MEVGSKIKRAELEQQQLERRLARSKRSVFRFLFGTRIERMEQQALENEIQLSELREQVDRLANESRLFFEGFSQDAFDQVQVAFRELRACRRIWDVTQRTHGQQYRSLASTSLEREPISASFELLPYVHPSHEAMHIRNANGGDLYLYPTLLVVYDSESNFALISLRDLNVEFNRSAFIEEEMVPDDSQVIGHTWKYTNKNGTPDRRFSNNFQIPIAAYGTLRFSTAKGLNEMYMFSHEESTRVFWEALLNHKRLLKEA